ncbi:MAG: cytochrome C [Sulfurovum sp.]|nr:cytochrome C [Sulfurovum sp.]
MKKILMILFATLVGLGFMATTASADVGKGQKIVLKKLKKACAKSGIEDGGILAKKHTQAEWKAANDAGKLNEAIKTLCPEAKELKEKYMTHVFDFLHNYASDSGNVPS